MRRGPSDGSARLVHRSAAMWKRAVGLALLSVVAAVGCGPECEMVCDDQYDRCVESGRPHEECHDARDHCFASCRAP